jgi:hypothetical protein
MASTATGEDRQAMSGANQTLEQVCTQKAILLDAYQAAAQQYSNALTELNRRIGISTRTEYAPMYETVELLRQDAALLQRELEWHVQHHGC